MVRTLPHLDFELSEQSVRPAEFELHMELLLSVDLELSPVAIIVVPHLVDRFLTAIANLITRAVESLA